MFVWLTGSHALLEPARACATHDLLLLLFALLEVQLRNLAVGWLVLRRALAFRSCLLPELRRTYQCRDAHRVFVLAARLFQVFLLEDCSIHVRRFSLVHSFCDFCHLSLVQPSPSRNMAIGDEHLPRCNCRGRTWSSCCLHHRTGFLHSRGKAGSQQTTSFRLGDACKRCATLTEIVRRPPCANDNTLTKTNAVLSIVLPKANEQHGYTSINEDSVALGAFVLSHGVRNRKNPCSAFVTGI